MEADFKGWATKSGIRCTDGRTILAHAFQTSDKETVPLVWQHQHDAPTNVLGHVILHSQAEGVRAEGFFNDTPEGKHAKALVKHKDLKYLSIYANGLVQQGMDVVHGIIREVSLVMAGANRGAIIDFVNLAHSGYEDEETETEAIIYNDSPIEFQVAAPPAAPPAPKPQLADLAHAADLTAAVPDAQSVEERTVEDVINTFNEEQRNVFYAMIGNALEQGAIQQSATATDQPRTDTSTDNQEGQDPVSRNVFDQTQDAKGGSSNTLTHEARDHIFAVAKKSGSLKEAVEEYALQHNISSDDVLKHGITNIDVMFPDARPVDGAAPDWISRRQEWVQGVLSGTRHTPFSRIKTMLADITLDEARARGYVKGAMKREEWFAVSKRVTTPQTVYKKQKLDRDDILDITDFDVVVWLKQEMRVMLDEEVARAILIGDGRDVADPDKINEANIRPILTDNEVYVTTVQVDDAAIVDDSEVVVDAIMTAMQYFNGTGQPTLYCARSWITKMLLTKDTLGRRLHATITELADAMGVGTIVPVDVMETIKDSVIGIIVNLADYTVGSDRGGEVSFFDDFDIDYNKFTYLYETRLSGALARFKAAIVVKQFTGSGTVLPDPAAPTFVKSTGVVTVVDHTTDHYTYVTVNDSTGAETAVSAYGAQTAITAGNQVHYRAKPAANYVFGSNAACNWTFQRPAA
jgi:Caudovirus prohead serine protease/Phage capsid family